ncbi:MAG TPA: ABC transporter ATP-binding protein [Polyangiaceae bacterium]
MISVSRLVKRYGDLLAVDGLSFEVGAGEVVGFLGPNGAGKSTTLRILAGFLGQTSGTVSVCGHDVAADSLEARRQIGYMPEAVPLYPEMRVVEYLAFRAELKNVARAKRAKAVDAAMEKAGVADRATSLIGKLSKGYRQRVGLADALVSSPPLLILDEPTAGLDPNQIRDVRKLLRELGKEHTVLLSTHILSEVESTCSRALVIAKGKLVAQGTIAELRKLRRSPALVIVVRGDAPKAEATLAELEVFSKIAVEADGEIATLRCAWKKKADAAENTERAVAALVAAGLAIRSAAPEQSTLEDVFAELTSSESRDRSEVAT